MKNFVYYLDLMEEPERSYAISACKLENREDKCYEPDMEIERHYPNRNDIQKSLAQAFIWSDTVQGASYWVGIFKKYKTK